MSGNNNDENGKMKQEEGMSKEKEIGRIEKENEIQEARIMPRLDEKHGEECKKLETRGTEWEKKEKKMNKRYD
jgi:hypothetical protein